MSWLKVLMVCVFHLLLWHAKEYFSLEISSGLITKHFFKKKIEIPRTDSEVEEEDSATSDPVETVDFTDILDGTVGSEDDADSFVDLKLEAEQEEPSIPLTGHEESEEEPTSAEVVETEETQEGGGLEEETGVTDLCGRDERQEAQPVSYLSDV